MMKFVNYIVIYIEQQINIIYKNLEQVIDAVNVKENVKHLENVKNQNRLKLDF
jgi:hypothetical protein